MKDYLIDTNIIIPLNNNDRNMKYFIRDLESGKFFMSAITYMEALIGIESENYAEFKHKFEHIDIIPVSKNIAEMTVEILKSRKSRNLKDKDIADIIIGSTAKVMNMTLITKNERDFKFIKGLKIVNPTLS